MIDLDAVRKRHRREMRDSGLEMYAACLDRCAGFWPCDAIQLADEIERWRSSFDGYPRHPGGLNANEFISAHNQMVIDWRKEIERLREALGFYADEDRYDEGMGGSVARAALHTEGGGDG